MTSAVTISPAEFMGAAPVAPVNSNTAWGSRYAGEIKRVIRFYSDDRPRSRQAHLGPSELGVECDRQVVGKLAGLPKTNHVTDPWPSFVGTAVHAELANAFESDNIRTAILRWIAEQRVYPTTAHSGTSDLYDAVEQAVVDHKALGESSMQKIRRAEGPPRKYYIQLLLYRLGYLRLGLPVRRVVIVAYPRTGSTLDGIYVWEHVPTFADEQLVEDVLSRTEIRKQVAAEVAAGRMHINHVPVVPDDDECYFCPFYRPQSARDNGPGCPGPRVK